MTRTEFETLHDEILALSAKVSEARRLCGYSRSKTNRAALETLEAEYRALTRRYVYAKIDPEGDTPCVP